MTTEVIIKNKSGLVMAADSAVTISNIFTTGKVYNSANKLFSLILLILIKYRWK